MQSHYRYPQAQQPTRHFRLHVSRDRQRSRVCRRSFRRFLQREGCHNRSRCGCCSWGRTSRRWCRCRGGRGPSETAHIGNQSFHVSIIHGQRDHAGSFHLGSGRFQYSCQLSGRILTGSVSQCWPRATGPTSPRGIQCSVENRKCPSPERYSHRLPNFQWCFRRSGCRRWFRCGWRTVRVRQESRNPSKDQTLPLDSIFDGAAAETGPVVAGGAEDGPGAGDATAGVADFP